MDANFYGHATSNFIPTSGFKWVDPKMFDLTCISSKECVLEVDLEYQKELRELHNDYSLAPDKIKIEREMLSEYQLKIDNLCDIPIGIVKKLVPKFFDKEKHVCHFENLKPYLRLGLKLKNIHRVLEFNQSQ